MVTDQFWDNLIQEQQQRADNWTGEKGETYWAGYRDGILRALKIYRQTNVGGQQE